MRANSDYGQENCEAISFPRNLSRYGGALCFAILVLICCQCRLLRAQSAATNAEPQTTEQKLEQLMAAMAQAQAQMETYQKQLIEMRQQLTLLQKQMAAEKSGSSSTAQATKTASTSASLEEIRERQAIEESQIATHDLTKVETQSKYPLIVSGMLLFNGFVNTRQVDIAVSPAYALSGSGSTGFSVRQTVLGLDARGPHLFGATSHADLRVDFFADSTVSDYSVSGILRLRTLHAALNWRNTEAFFELDRSILEPNAPTSLAAVAQPELAWAGNLWTWNPQIGVSHQIGLTHAARIKLQGALIDTSDPQIPGSTASAPPVSQTERSRWPGTEARIAFLHGENGIGPEIGVGGYFSPHRAADGDRFNAWAATMDFRLPLTKRFEITMNAYRGQALASLGGDGYVNYLARYAASTEVVQGLDDIGGWAQFKAKLGQRVEINTGYGIDNPFAKEIRAEIQASDPTTYTYPGLERNKSFYSNAIYSPSAYLIFSLEYKRLWTNYSSGPASLSDGIGIGAGYKF